MLKLLLKTFKYFQKAVYIQINWLCFNFFLASGDFCHLINSFQIVWTQIKTDRMSVLNWIK